MVVETVSENDGKVATKKKRSEASQHRTDEIWLHACDVNRKLSVFVTR
jgi:hypothetical protein